MVDMKTGLIPSRKRGGRPNNAAVNAYPIANGYGSDIFKGDPVKVTAGYIQVATNTAKCVGVFAGCAYIDPVTKTQVRSNYFPTGTSSSGTGKLEGYSSPIAYVYDDPEQTFIIKANASVTAGQIGDRFQVVIGTGDTVTGQSAALIATTLSVGTSAGHMVRVLGLYQLEGNDQTDAQPLLEVELSNPGLVGA